MLQERPEEEIARLREENMQLKRDFKQRQAADYCKEHGHKWFRSPYCGISDVNYLTCERCGAETTD